MKQYILTLVVLILTAQFAFCQKNHSDAVIVGHVVCKGEHLPFVNVTIKGTTIGTTTDETGHYRLVHLPVGKLIMVVSGIGYKTSEKVVNTEADKTIEVKFDIEEDAL